MEIRGKPKKTTQGRQRIEIKKIENLSNRQVTFSKRRVGLFKKASELCILSGAEVAIIVHSLGKRVFSFGHPNVDSVIGRFLNGSTISSESSTPDQVENFFNTPDYNRHYDHVSKELEMEKNRKLAIEEAKKEVGDGWWWDADVDGLDLEELKVYMAQLEELMKNVNTKANEIVVIQNSKALNGLDQSMETLPYVNDNVGMNYHSQISLFDYGNVFLPFNGDFVKHNNN